jgi:hypothetical protein
VVTLRNGHDMPIRLSESRPLSIKERLFVDKYIQLGACKGAGKVSAEHAGYPPSWSRFAAHRMLKNPRVMRAIEAESKRLLRALGPKAIHVLSEILDDKEHRDRLKAARTIIERIDPTLVAHAYSHRVDVTVHDNVETSLRMLRAMRETCRGRCSGRNSAPIFSSSSRPRWTATARRSSPGRS